MLMQIEKNGVWYEEQEEIITYIDRSGKKGYKIKYRSEDGEVIYLTLRQEEEFNKD